MDVAIILLVIILLIMLYYNPGIQMLIERIKPNKNKQEEKKCYHTPDDCLDCVVSTDCPMKNENVIHVIKRTDEYTD